MKIESDQKISNSDLDISDEIDLRELFKILWDGKKLIIFISFVFSVCSIVYALMLSNYYQSESIMSVRNSAENQGAMSQFSGAASLMGVNLSSGDNKSMEVIQLIQSRKFVRHLLTFEKVLPSIMASKSYESTSNELLFDPEIYDMETKTWKGIPNKNGAFKPSYLEAYGVYMDSLLSISLDKGTGFILISVQHISPIFAKEFLELIIREANSFLRNKDLDESNQALQFLKSQLSETSLVELRESIHTLIEAQLEIQMMAKINEDYILVEIDPPFIPEKSLSNSKTLIVIFSTIFGGLFGGVVVLLREYLLENKKSEIV